ncbi:MAG: NAD/NADP octopine/nopaline dehydrogenase family protein [Desulfovibrio sp.]|nr:NAD/NADP octopine/nopaline dehydrogenase family protein [Desulfovibrio sp.]
MNIAILGGGNIGTLMAAECARKGHRVTVHTSRPDGWSLELGVHDREDAFLFSGRIAGVTADLAHAVRGADVIFITLPAETFPALARELAPHVRPGQRMGVIPGSGGAEFAFRELLQKGAGLFGVQRVHSIARLRERGRSVAMLGRKAELQLAAIPGADAQEHARMMEGLFDMPCRVLPNYLSVTLTPSNPLLHTARLYSLFRDWHGQDYPRNVLFYEEWDDLASEMLLRADAELQQLCATLPLELESVKSLREHYESATVAEMTRKIRSIPAFRALPAPMRRTDRGWQPDLTSRYFTTDFSYGLKILLDICGLFHVPSPAMQELWDWYTSVRTPAHSFALGLSREEFLGLYS